MTELAFYHRLSTLIINVPNNKISNKYIIMFSISLKILLIWIPNYFLCHQKSHYQGKIVKSGSYFSLSYLTSILGRFRRNIPIALTLMVRLPENFILISPIMAPRPQNHPPFKSLDIYRLIHRSLCSLCPLFITFILSQTEKLFKYNLYDIQYYCLSRYQMHLYTGCSV